jgi:Domain of unknown function (DUF4160)
MPIISTFFGIIIRMYFGDHNPPHFHAELQGEKATFTFDGQLRSGNISSATARKLVRDWAHARLGASSQARAHDKLEQY